MRAALAFQTAQELAARAGSRALGEPTDGHHGARAVAAGDECTSLLKRFPAISRYPSRCEQRHAAPAFESAPPARLAWAVCVGCEATSPQPRRRLTADAQPATNVPFSAPRCAASTGNRASTGAALARHWRAAHPALSRRALPHLDVGQPARRRSSTSRRARVRSACGAETVQGRRGAAGALRQLRQARQPPTSRARSRQPRGEVGSL